MRRDFDDDGGVIVIDRDSRRTSLLGDCSGDDDVIFLTGDDSLGRKWGDDGEGAENENELIIIYRPMPRMQRMKRLQ